MKVLSLSVLAALVSAVAAQGTPPPVVCDYEISKFKAAKQKAQPHANIDFDLLYNCPDKTRKPKGHCFFQSTIGDKFYDADGVCGLPLKNFTFNFRQEDEDSFLLTIQHKKTGGSKSLPVNLYEQNGKDYATYVGKRSFRMYEGAYE